MSAGGGSAEFLAAAEAIGTALCKAAVWDDAGERCNWLGRGDIQEPGGGVSVGNFALFTYLAGGSSGIALFLGELAARARDTEARRTALGAWRRTIRYARAKPAQGLPPSFLSGHLGIAFVLQRLRDLDVVDDGDDDLDWCLGEIERTFDDAHPLDYMGGSAGVIPILLHYRDAFGGARALELAERFGDELIADAKRSNGMATWEASRSIGRGMDCPPLTGMSHGASGMALALLELHAVTGRSDCLVIAREAFAYEDSSYSASRGNWLDLRSPFTTAGSEPEGLFQVAWCHGAPGIALVRLRAAQIDTDRSEQYRAKAVRALDSTICGIAERLDRPRFDASLCHGIAGLSEILLIASELADDDSLRRHAEATTSELVRRYGGAGDWPGGTTTGDLNPTFLLGIAGIGHHCLRLDASEATPPVLLPRARSDMSLAVSPGPGGEQVREANRVIVR